MDSSIRSRLRTNRKKPQRFEFTFADLHPRLAKRREQERLENEDSGRRTRGRTANQQQSQTSCEGRARIRTGNEQQKRGRPRRGKKEVIPARMISPAAHGQLHLNPPTHTTLLPSAARGQDLELETRCVQPPTAGLQPKTGKVLTRKHFNQALRLITPYPHPHFTRSKGTLSPSFQLQNYICARRVNKKKCLDLPPHTVCLKDERKPGKPLPYSSLAVKSRGRPRKNPAPKGPIRVGKLKVWPMMLAAEIVRLEAEMAEMKPNLLKLSVAPVTEPSSVSSGPTMPVPFAKEAQSSADEDSQVGFSPPDHRSAPDSTEYDSASTVEFVLPHLRNCGGKRAALSDHEQAASNGRLNGKSRPARKACISPNYDSDDSVELVGLLLNSGIYVENPDANNAERDDD